MGEGRGRVWGGRHGDWKEEKRRGERRGGRVREGGRGALLTSHSPLRGGDRAVAGPTSPSQG